MSFLAIKNVKIVGMSAGVPLHVYGNELGDTFVKTEDIALFENSTGVKEKRLDPNLTTSDLSVPAVERLLQDMRWEKQSIGALFFVSQTADYILPATACILQDRLGLSKECYAMDISLGCSGWVYGLSSAAALVSAGNGNSFKRALLIAGDAKGRVPQSDPLLGCASTVTALEFDEGAGDMYFHFGTDGSGYEAIMIPDGGARNGISSSSFETYEYDGRLYNRLQSRMSGIDVFSFAISTAPQSVRTLVEHFDIGLYDFDYYVFHQANKTINSHIVRKLKIDSEKVPSSIEHFGNTSSASIPLTIVTQLKGQVENTHRKFLCCGFGVGLSWGSVAFETEDLVIPDLVELGESE